MECKRFAVRSIGKDGMEAWSMEVEASTTTGAGKVVIL